MRIHNLLLITLTVIFFGCGKEKKLTPGEGYINVTGGKVWYKIVLAEKMASYCVQSSAPSLKVQ